MTRSRDNGNVGHRAYKKNYLINGGFDIWQRGNEYINPTTGSEYNSVDRWRFRRDSNATGLRVVRTPTATDAGFLDVCNVRRETGDTLVNPIFMLTQLESKDVVKLQGKEATLSVRLRLGGSFSASSVRIDINTGTGIDEAVSLADGNFATGNVSHESLTAVDASKKDVYQTATFTISVPLDATELNVRFQWIPIGNAVDTEDGIRFAYVQLEEGSVATEFEYRSYGEELALCKRYYQNDFPIVWAAVVDTDANLKMATIGFPIAMRNVPTLTYTTDILTPSVAATTVGASLTGTTGLASQATWSNITCDAEL